MSFMKKTQRRKLGILSVIAAFLIGIAAFGGVADAIIPDSFSQTENTPLLAGGDAVQAGRFTNIITDSVSENSICKTYQAQSVLFGAIPVKSVDITVVKNIRVLPGGMPFGVKLYTKGILVVGISEVSTAQGSFSPAHIAGIRVKDLILKVNGTTVNTVEEVTSVIEKSEGNPLLLTVRRGNEELEIKLKPVLGTGDSVYKAGIWIRDNTAGIGTVTFILPESGSFGGLGHGICDVDTGELMPLLRGTVLDVTISGVVPGTPGTPGELKGFFNSLKTGTMMKNSPAGVFGVFSEIPETTYTPIPVGLKNEVKEGKATVLCTLDENGICAYEVQISGLNKGGNDLKSFTVTVTDPLLLQKTGGIVQGMSGSPIIQNGKLIGAVTHVLINDPSRGYGTYIENMLAQMPEMLK